MIKHCVVILIIVCLFFSKSTSENEKVCRFMNPELGPVLSYRSNWNFLTGFWCYFYNDPKRFKIIYTHRSIVYNNSRIYVSLINNNTDFFWYDYTNETSLYYVGRSFIKDVFFKKWIKCARDAVSCCDNFMNEENIQPSYDYPCPAVWDSWSCFSPTKAGTTARQLCPEITFSSESPACELESEKQCFSNGTWTSKTNYDVCALAPHLRARHRFHIIVLAVASILTFPALIIFTSFRNLRQKLLFILHRNLILVIIIRNILTILTKELIIMDELTSSDTASVMSDNGVPCRVLVFFENVAKNAIFACMLVDGFYLHKTIVRAFAKEPSLISVYLAVTVLSFVPSIIWAILRGVHDGLDCWLVDRTSDQWVCDGLRFGILGINTFLLIDIVRVMILKLKQGGISQQTRTTFKVTLFLIPLFGIHIIIISNRNMVSDNSCKSHDVYYYLSYLIEGFQGIMVSLLFCYIQPDVRREFSNAFRKFLITLDQRFDFDCTKSIYKRRPTTTTFLGSETRGSI